MTTSAARPFTWPPSAKRCPARSKEPAELMNWMLSRCGSTTVRESCLVTLPVLRVLQEQLDGEEVALGEEGQVAAVRAQHRPHVEAAALPLLRDHGRAVGIRVLLARGRRRVVGADGRVPLLRERGRVDVQDAP